MPINGALTMSYKPFAVFDSDIVSAVAAHTLSLFVSHCQPSCFMCLYAPIKGLYIIS